MSHIKFEEIGACVFDAYGTLFDVNAAARETADQLGANWQPLAETWRAKQLQYTWLRSLMRRHADFWQVTADALDYAMGSLGLEDDALRGRLLDLYKKLPAYPEVKSTLTDLKGRGLRLGILSNGSPQMLASAVSHAGIGELLDAVMSVEQVGVFKPAPEVYQIAVDHLGLPAGRMCFVSSNAWDAQAAKAFGYRVVWCNRSGQAAERIPEKPDRQITDLSGLLEIL